MKQAQEAAFGMKASQDVDGIRGIVEEWLARRLPNAQNVRVGQLSRPGTGLSNETMVFDASWQDAGGDRRESFVLRVQPSSNQLFLNGDVFFQSTTMAAFAERSTVPVPLVRWREADERVLGAPFYVMRRVAGEDGPSSYDCRQLVRLSPTARATLYRNALATLAQIHQVPVGGLGFLHEAFGPEPGLSAYLRSVRAWYAWARPSGGVSEVECALDQLDRSMPGGSSTSIVWGDSRPGNMMFNPDDQTVVAVLDWEMAATGTPEVDLAWWLMAESVFAHLNETITPEGVPDRASTIEIYQSFLGRPVINLPYFDLLAWTRYAILLIRHIDLSGWDDPHRELFVELNGVVSRRLRQMLAEF
jgi:aminoglycoside phosphotransferase (APT) family kinase protein